MTVEPRVEDLLSTIRKAIDADMASIGAPPATSSETRGTLLRGALREMRVSVTANSDDAAKADREIAELREKIGRGRGNPVAPTASPLSRHVPRQTLKPEPVGRVWPGDTTPPPPLRPTVHEPQAPVAHYYDEPYEEPQEAAWPAAEQTHYPQDDHYEPQVPAPLVSPRTAYQAQNSFQQLADSLMSRATGERGIESLTQDLLRGMLKQWLDDNLPELVERLVREEIERVARRGR